MIDTNFDPVTGAETPREQEHRTTLRAERNGKIARLPHAVREEVNRRMRDGQRGRRIVEWLNTLPEVREVMEAEFGGGAVRAQNLSEWRKRGGYREWILREEAMEVMQRMVASGTSLPGKEELTEMLALWVTARYAGKARSVDETPGEDGWRRLREMCADVCNCGAATTGRSG